jgi:hypothetical protein
VSASDLLFIGIKGSVIVLNRASLRTVLAEKRHRDEAAQAAATTTAAG